ncbi:MAG: type III-A CRISPR-associated RAMP protein Csm5 [Olsenella sp.]
MPSKRYRLTLTVEGLVHIGDGGKYGKKDYFLERGKVSILDAPAFVAKLNPEQLNSYCEFLKEDSHSGLQDYLGKNKVLAGTIRKAVLYQLDSLPVPVQRGSYQHFDIWRFVKDAHGCPYVPGSSIKGMLRTAILISLIARDRQAYERLYSRERVLKDRQRADGGIQRKAFWVGQLDRGGDSAVNDVLRYLSVSDSDPLSVDDLVLAKKYDKFSKRDDGRHKKKLRKTSDEEAYYQGNELPIYRECLRPGTTIRTTLTVDERICQYFDDLRLDRDGLPKALLFSYELYKKCFLRHFDIDGGTTSAKKDASSDGRCKYIYESDRLAGMRCRNRAVDGTDYCNTHKKYATVGGAAGDPAQDPICYLGGGTDFNTKTIENALFVDEGRRVDEISHILFDQFPTKLDEQRHAALKAEVQRAGFRSRPMDSQYKRNGQLKKAKEDHRHWCDGALGVSPHTLKMGKVQDKMYPMGKCRARFEELEN